MQKMSEKNNNSPSSEVKQYKLFNCGRNDLSQKLPPDTTTPPPLPSPSSSNYLVGILGVSIYVVG